MSDKLIDVLRQQQTGERDDAKRKVLRALDSLANTVESVRKDVETDNKVIWWADHTQGLVYGAASVERAINQLIVWDRVLGTLGYVEDHVTRTEGTPS